MAYIIGPAHWYSDKNFIGLLAKTAATEINDLFHQPDRSGIHPLGGPYALPRS